ASSARCDARKKNAAERSRRRRLLGANDRHAGGELRSVAAAGTRAAWSRRRAKSRAGDRAAPRRGGLAPRVGAVSTSRRSHRAFRTALAIPSFIHTELAQLWAQMALSH